jgi:hypothetical protein
MIGLPRKTVFIDRNSGGRSFRDAIVAANINVVLHDDLFRITTTADHVWLKKVGTLGYAMVTADIAVERSFLFLDTLKRSKSHVFILCGLNHASPDARAKCIIDAYPEMLSLCHANPGPRLWKQKPLGKILEVNFRHNYGLLKRDGKKGDIRM